MSFPLELDHVVVFTSVDAPEAQALESLGLTGFGGITQHGNLGTASTSFFFENVYLELLWVHDESAAREVLTSVGFDMSPRMTWRETTASPFGLMLRRRSGSTAALPFPTRQIKAEWMPGDVFVDFAVEVCAEPFYGIIPECLTYASFKSNISVLPHALGVKRLTGVKITVENNDLSSNASLLSTNGVATIEAGPSRLMELTFDDGRQGKTVDVRPTVFDKIKIDHPAEIWQLKN